MQALAVRPPWSRSSRAAWPAGCRLHRRRGEDAADPGEHRRPPPRPARQPAPRPRPARRPARSPSSPRSLPVLAAGADGRGVRQRRPRTRRGCSAQRRLHPVRGELPQRRPDGVRRPCSCPTGTGPFPAVVLNHGYIEPSVYVTGQGLMREQDYLARAGFVVLHTDYRGHAASDPAGDRDRETRLGYTRDAINAVQPLQAASRTSTRTGWRCSAARWAAG